eukprot:gene9346-17049_t
MPKSCFWGIYRSGQLFYFTLDGMEWRSEKPNVSKQSFKKISALDYCAWGLGADQRLYVCLFKTDIPVRVQLIVTDRPAWSSEDGTKNTPKESFEVEAHWQWENDWFKDQSNEFDTEGWQYAIDFPRTFSKNRGKFSFVRRCKWSRYKCFKDFGKWIRVHWKEDKKDPFQDVAIGGSHLPRQMPGYLAVWALTFCGKVLYREGISQSCPEGTGWVRLNSSEDLNLVQISVGPSGLLWAVQWDGTALARIGISQQNPTGEGWKEIKDSTNGLTNSGFLQVSVGTNAVWALGRNRKVYYRKGIDTSKAYTDHKFACGSGWVEMFGEFSLVSVGPNDQVWTIDKGGSVVIRTDVTPLEPAGKKWKLLMSAPGLSDAPVGIRSDGLSHWIWISSGGCNVDATFFKKIEGNLHSARSSCASLGSVKTRISKEPWRLKVLDLLKRRNEDVMSRYRTFDGTRSDESYSQWSKTASCFLLTDRVLNMWCECHIKIFTDEESNVSVLIYYSNGEHFKETRIPLNEVSAVNLTKIPSHPNTFVINTLERTYRRTPLIISMESEKEVNEWIVLITVEAAKVRLIQTSRKPTKHSVWATSVCGDVFYCPQTTLEGVALDRMFWLQVGGHMKSVTAGVDGIVWAIGYDGKAYAYSGGEGGGILQGSDFSDENMYEQEDTEDVFIYENQRWNPIQGFSDTLLPSDRWAWSDESGMYHCPKDGYRLPSSQWKWEGGWSFVYAKGETDEQGWQYAMDFPRRYHSYKGVKDYVRRRKWQRKCKLKTTGPWILVESDIRLVDVAIQTDPGDTVAYCVGVWAVSTNGDVYYRDSVFATQPTGHSWRRIPTNVKFVSISVGSNKKVWGIAEDGVTYLRGGFGKDAQVGTQWFTCYCTEKIPLRKISVGTDAVLALDDKGKLWRRKGITATFPEGTEWIECMDRFQDVSIGYRNNTWIVRNKDIEICIKKDHENPAESGVICVLSGDWNTVCVRGCTPEVDEAEECVESRPILNQEQPLMPLLQQLPLSTNSLNGEVSIFDLYKQPDESDDDSDDFGLDDDSLPG